LCVGRRDVQWLKFKRNLVNHNHLNRLTKEKKENVTRNFRLNFLKLLTVNLNFDE